MGRTVLYLVFEIINWTEPTFYYLRPTHQEFCFFPNLLLMHHLEQKTHLFQNVLSKIFMYGKITWQELKNVSGKLITGEWLVSEENQQWWTHIRWFRLPRNFWTNLLGFYPSLIQECSWKLSPIAIKITPAFWKLPFPLCHKNMTRKRNLTFSVRKLMWDVWYKTRNAIIITVLGIMLNQKKLLVSTMIKCCAVLILSLSSLWLFSYYWLLNTNLTCWVLDLWFCVFELWSVVTIWDLSDWSEGFKSVCQCITALNLT